MGLFTPLYKSKDPEKRIKWITKNYNLQNSKHQKILADIAKNDNSWHVRELVIEKLSDQDFIAHIAKNDNSFSVRQKAYQKLGLENSQEALADIVKYGGELKKILNAIEKITDQTFLKSIVENNKIYHIRNAAYKRLGLENSQEALADTIKNEIYSGYRLSAAKKITDQNILNYLVKNEKDKEIRNAAVEKIIDENILTDIAKNDKEYNIRITAVKKLTDQYALADIAKNAKYHETRAAVVEKLLDQNLIAQIAFNDSHENVRKSAVERLLDQNLLDEIAKNDKNMEVQITASLKLEDISLKLENLIRLFPLSIETKSENRVKIADVLKELYNQNNISQHFKNEMIQFKGKEIRGHIDYHQDCSLHDDRIDLPAEYFDI